MQIQLMQIIQLVRWLACGGEVENCPGGKPAYGFVASEVGEFAGESFSARKIFRAPAVDPPHPLLLVRLRRLIGGRNSAPHWQG